MLLSEELAAALDERAGRDELRRAGLVAGLLKSVERSIKLTKSELDKEKLKVANEALSAGKALLAAYVKEQWPKGAPTMDTRGPTASKGTHTIRRLLSALGGALDKLGDPGDRGFDDVADVKIGKAEDALFTKRARVPRG